jgi:hypothetical protein
MDLRVEGKYEQVLLRLVKHYGHPTAMAMIRQLILQEALENDLWNTETEQAHSPDDEATNGTGT